MSNWFETLQGLHGRVWDTLDAGVRHADHPARYPTFATVSHDGWPEARTIVLRGINQGDGTLKFYTDRESSKITSLGSVPMAAIHVWDHAQQLQIRLQAQVTVLSGDAVQADWDSVPDHRRNSYGITPAPGQPIANALDYVKNPDRATFAVLQCRVATIDAVHLGDDHRRAGYSRDDDWAGQWLSP